MRYVRWRVLVALLVSIFLSATAAAALTQSTWRPYNNPHVLVQVGMSKGEVLLKAGQPDMSEIISLGTDGFPSMSVWTYLRSGHNAAVATLTFRGERLVRIETAIVQ